MVKIFCIGFNKTGTLTLLKSLEELNFKIVPRDGSHRSSKYMPNISNGDYEDFLKFCGHPDFEVYKDVPFSTPDVWKRIYAKFPDAIYILTVRDSNKWYNSIKKFHQSVFAPGKDTIRKEDLQFHSHGDLWHYYKYTFQPKDEDLLYIKEEMVPIYEKHNRDILKFFESNSKFIAIDVSEKDSYMKLCDFLKIKNPPRKIFEHYNKFNSH